MPFYKSTTTPTPDALFDDLLGRLPASQLRVLLYAVRRCYGFERAGPSDEISLSQFEHGQRDKDGNSLDEGTGLSRNTIIAALADLDRQGLLVKTPHRDPRGGDATTTYRLALVAFPERIAPRGWRHITTHGYPDELFDFWLPRLRDAELRVLCYILRRTLGFGKGADVISRDQFLTGIVRKDGRPLDRGCGIKERALYPAINSLKARGLIYTRQRRNRIKGNIPTEYGLVFEGEAPGLAELDPRALPHPDIPLSEQDELARRADWVVPIGQDGSAAHAQTGVQSVRRGGHNSCIEEDAAHAQSGVQTVRPPSMHDLHPQQRGNQVTVKQATESQEKHHQQGAARAAAHDGLAGGGVIDMGGKEILGATLSGPVCVAINSEPTTRRQDSGGETLPVDGTCAGQAEGIPQTPGAPDTEEIILATEGEIRAYTLADDEVLLDAGEGRAQAMPLRAVVCNDILATRDSYVPVRTGVYYSVEHFLGEGGAEWTPEEERKIGRHNALHAELDALYGDIAAFSLEEALGQYFTEDLVRRYAGGEQRRRERVRGWLRYVHSEAGASLTNPAGFLRTRLESPQWAPRGETSQRRSGRGRRV